MNGEYEGPPGRLFSDDYLYPKKDPRWKKSEVSLTSLSGHARQVNSVAFNKSGNLLASGSDDGSARLWDVETLKTVSRFEGATDDAVVQLCWDPQDDKRIATLGGDQRVRWWDARASSQRPTASLKLGHEYINIAWHDASIRMAVGSSVEAKDEGQTSKDGVKDCVSLVDTRKLSSIWKRLKFNYEVNEFCWAPPKTLGRSCDHIMLTTEHGTVEVLPILLDDDTNTKVAAKPTTSTTTTTTTTTTTPQEMDVDQGDASIRKDHLVDDDSDDDDDLQDQPKQQPQEEQEKIEPYTMHGHTDACFCIANRGRMLAVGSKDSLVSLWDLNYMCSLRCVTRHVTPVRCVALSFDLMFVASAAYDPGIDIAHVDDTDLIYHVDVPFSMHSVAWHPSRYLLAFAPEVAPTATGPAGLKTDAAPADMTHFVQLLTPPPSLVPDPKDNITNDPGPDAYQHIVFPGLAPYL